MKMGLNINLLQLIAPILQYSVEPKLYFNNDDCLW